MATVNSVRNIGPRSGDVSADNDETIDGNWQYNGDYTYGDNDHILRGTNSTIGIYDTVQGTYVLWFDRRAIANNIGGPEYNGAVRFSNCMLWENNNGEIVVRDSGGVDTVIS